MSEHETSEQTPPGTASFTQRFNRGRAGQTSWPQAAQEVIGSLPEDCPLKAYLATMEERQQLDKIAPIVKDLATGESSVMPSIGLYAELVKHALNEPAAQEGMRNLVDASTQWAKKNYTPPKEQGANSWHRQ